MSLPIGKPSIELPESPRICENVPHFVFFLKFWFTLPLLHPVWCGHIGHCNTWTTWGGCLTLENLSKTDSSKSWEGLDTGEIPCYRITSHPFTNSQGSPLIKRRDIFLRKIQFSTEEEEPKNQGWWWDLRIWIKQGNELYFAKYWGFHNDDLNYSGNNIIERYRTIWRS